MSEEKKTFYSAYNLPKVKGQHFDPVYRYSYIREDGKRIKNEINMEKEIDSVNYLTSQEMVAKGEISNAGSSDGYIDGRNLPANLDSLIDYIKRIKDVVATQEENPKSPETKDENK